MRIFPNRPAVLAFAAALAGAAAAPAAHAAEAARGTDGLVVVPFEARNDGAAPIVCAVAVAHWYSVELGRAGPGAAVAARLWADPAGGTVFVLNAHGDRLPVERLWCGLAGRGWATRSPVALGRRAGEAPAPIRLACAANGERLACR